MTCALLSPKSDKEQAQAVARMSPAYTYQRDGLILSVPIDTSPRELILALRELERLAIEDYLRRTSDGGGT